MTQGIDLARTILLAGMVTILPASLGAAQPSGEPTAAATPTPRPWTAVTAEDPLIVHTLYTWYSQASFKKASVKPLEMFSSDDPDYYRRYFSLLRANGVDVVAGILTGLAGETRADGSSLPTSYQADNLLRIVPLVGSAGMKFFIYYDTAIRSWWKNGLKTGQLELTNPQLRDQIRSDFAWIADEVIAKHEDDYLFLQYKNGREVLDEQGRTRPVIAIYIARAFQDQPGFPNLRRLFESELAEVFHARGLGRPALVLDAIFWDEPRFDPEAIRAFGSSAAAITSFCPVYKRPDVSSLGDWVPLFGGLYQDAAKLLVDLVGRGVLSRDLQIWPGVMPNFETRSDHSGKARDLRDWEAMLRMGLTATRRVQQEPDDNPIRAMLIVYADEFYEGTPLLSDNGLFTLPLTVQGNVLKDAGVWLDRF